MKIVVVDERVRRKNHFQSEYMAIREMIFGMSSNRWTSWRQQRTIDNDCFIRLNSLGNQRAMSSGRLLHLGFSDKVLWRRADPSHHRNHRFECRSGRRPVESDHRAGHVAPWCILRRRSRVVHQHQCEDCVHRSIPKAT